MARCERTVRIVTGATLACAAAFGCSPAEASAPEQPAAAPTSTDAIPSGVLAGSLASRPFALKSARYHIDRRFGYDQLQLGLSGGEASGPCGEPAAHAASVWLRRRGSERITATTVRLAPGEKNAWQVHYQVHGDHGWVGNGDASALIAIQEVRADEKLTGELWACFVDREKSCVSGRFRAEYCPERLDAPVRGSESMERLPPHAGRPEKEASP